MGSCSSCANHSAHIKPLDAEETVSSVLAKKYRETKLISANRWRIKLSKSEARKAYVADGTLPADASNNLLALRTFLDDPNSLIRFADFVRKKGKLDYLLCWIEMLSYRLISEGHAFKMSTANHIYHKYCKENAVVPLPWVVDAIPKEHRECVRGLIEISEKRPSYALPHSLFDPFAHECLSQIEQHLYQPFQSSIMYIWTLIARKKQYNHVGVDDFEYMELLGQGGFGMVVHCKKKSTGKHYAMKIQSKVGLLEVVRDRPKRVTCERDVLVKCHHPFIISMDYAFQTAEFAILVTALGSGTSLKSCLKISEERVRFYAAEIVLALNHIHEMGMIYRDLKPANVLLNADGHIQLVDMGGVVDVDGETVGGGLASMAMHGDESSDLFASSHMLPSKASSMYQGNHNSSLYSIADHTKSAEQLKSGDESKSVDEPKSTSVVRKRARTIMGTAGYMAPEMLYEKALPRTTRRGYTSAVDYWALGVTIFVLLTGSLPFPPDKVAGFIEFIDRQEGNSSIYDPPDYTVWYNWVVSRVDADLLSDSSMDFLTGLLTIDECKRLGSGLKGIRKVKGHAWFRHISWNLLEQKLVKPPKVGPPKSTTEHIMQHEPYASFDAMMDSIGDDFSVYRYSTGLHHHEQDYFRLWDFVAPAALKVEVGVEEEERARRLLLQSHPTVQRIDEDEKSQGSGSYEPLGQGAAGSAVSQLSFGTTVDTAVLANLTQVLKTLNGSTKGEAKRNNSNSLSTPHTKLSSPTATIEPFSPMTEIPADD